MSYYSSFSRPFRYQSKNLRVVAILKIWIDLHPGDWSGNVNLDAFGSNERIQRLKRQLLVRQDAIKNHQTTLKNLETASGQSLEADSEGGLISADIQDGLYVGLSIINFDPLEIAQQLCLIDYEYFATIPLSQFTLCCSSSGMKRPPFELCRMIQHSNRV